MKANPSTFSDRRHLRKNALSFLLSFLSPLLPPFLPPIASPVHSLVGQSGSAGQTGRVGEKEEETKGANVGEMKKEMRGEMEESSSVDAPDPGKLLPVQGKYKGLPFNLPLFS